MTMLLRKHHSLPSFRGLTTTFVVTIILLSLSSLSDAKSVTEVVVEPIVGAKTDCSEYTQRIQLADDVSMDYVLTDVSLSVQMTFDTQAWVSLAISPDPSGKMVGSQAIIGLPNLAVSATNPGKYILVSYPMYDIS